MGEDSVENKNRLNEEEDEEPPDNYFLIISFEDRIKHNQSLARRFKNVLFKVYITIVAYYFCARISGYLLFLKSPTSGFSVQNFQFMTAIMIAVLLSNIFGSVAGTIGTLIGDITYQLVSNGTIFWHYTLSITFLAFISGIFYYKKDKTIPKKQIMKFFYLLVGGVMASFGFIILIVALQNPSFDFNSSSGEIFLRNTAQFMISEIISVLFVVPVIILIIDRILHKLANPFNAVYSMVLTHHTPFQSDHAIPLKIGGYYLFFCTRCTGMVFGIITAIFIESILTEGFRINIPETVAFYIALFSAIPGLIDWGTQKMGLRKSTDASRIITGLMIGTGMHMIGQARSLQTAVTILLIVYFTIFGLLLFLGYRKAKRKSARNKIEND